MRKLRAIAVLVLVVAATMTATAFATRGTNVTAVRDGWSASFVGTGWTCHNLGTSVTCRHGNTRPYLTLTNRHGRAFIVIVHPASGKAGVPSRTQQRGDPVPVYVFSSPPR